MVVFLPSPHVIPPSPPASCNSCNNTTPRGVSASGTAACRIPEAAFCGSASLTVRRRGGAPFLPSSLCPARPGHGCGPARHQMGSRRCSGGPDHRRARSLSSQRAAQPAAGAERFCNNAAAAAAGRRLSLKRPSSRAPPSWIETARRRSPVGSLRQRLVGDSQ